MSKALSKALSKAIQRIRKRSWWYTNSHRICNLSAGDGGEGKVAEDIKNKNIQESQQHSKSIV